jgi:hypothetical protein
MFNKVVPWKPSSSDDAFLEMIRHYLRVSGRDRLTEYERLRPYYIHSFSLRHGDPQLYDAARNWRREENTVAIHLELF